MNDFDNAIEIVGLTKKYDGFTLNDVSFNVPKGSIMGFIGQNGAGKTTTIKAILNIIKADSGKINIFGMDNTEHEYEIKENIAAVFDELPFHDSLSAKQLEKILGGIYKSWDNAKFKEYLERFCLPEKKPFGKFSKGMKMKLQIAAALSHNAKLLIMDEATTGLDPVVRDEILHIFLEYLRDENNSILMSSHITSDLEKIADSVTFIDKGRLLLTGYKDDIIANHGVLKCSRSDYGAIDKCDIVSARISDFGVCVMVSDKNACEKKYPGIVMDNTTLDEIMVYYVNADKKEWT
ncbi:MAG: ABC transporter ATP-binding protein [Huintestinicola sp.]|uniref:ABC transporter ATP-binding protein n=1 Tax=Huintestinicola sp. TaxID=2981661 RepID=UPI003F0B055B